MFRRIIGVCSFFFQTTASLADASDLCLTAARRAAAQYNIPVQIMVSLTLTETGRSSHGALRPWPWAVNNAGQGQWFESMDQAITFAHQQVARGERNFDVGCFQINYRWHGENFPSMEHAFDPMGNALYAAGFLRDLYQETGDWVDAAAQFHSRTPSVAARYRSRFETILASISDGTTRAEPTATHWFASSGKAGLGSLVLLQGTD